MKKFKSKERRTQSLSLSQAQPPEGKASYKPSKLQKLFSTSSERREEQLGTTSNSNVETSTPLSSKQNEKLVRFFGVQPPLSSSAPASSVPSPSTRRRNQSSQKLERFFGSSLPATTEATDAEQSATSDTICSGKQSPSTSKLQKLLGSTPVRSEAVRWGSSSGSLPPSDKLAGRSSPSPATPISAHEASKVQTAIEKGDLAFVKSAIRAHGTCFFPTAVHIAITTLKGRKVCV